MRNIKITDKTDKALEQGGGSLIWFIPLFLFCAWLTYEPAQRETMGFYPTTYQHRLVNHDTDILTIMGWHLL